MDNTQSRRSAASSKDSISGDSLGRRHRQRARHYSRPPVSPRRERLNLIWDTVIIVLVVINLLLILFDMLYSLTPLPRLMEAISPSLNTGYAQLIHDNFAAIDLAFVAIFALDVVGSWAFAIAERRYHRWFFYPFVHWYDVLGCIPLAGFRVLRLLRVIGLIIRLQRSHLIDIRQWAVYDFCNKYYQILLEELSDRVMIKMLTTVQEQVSTYDGLPGRIANEVIAPRQQRLVDDIARRLQHAVDQSYGNNRQEINAYISGLLHRAINENAEIRRLRRMPFGDTIVGTMDSALNDVITRVVHEAVLGIRTPEFKHLAGDLANSSVDMLLRSNASTNREIEQMLIDVLEVLKDQVQIQRWRERYEQ